MKITIPFKTPTINHLYFIWNNRRIMTREAKKVREKIIEIVDKVSTDYLLLTSLPLKAHIDVYENWLNKDGSVKKMDIANREKFLIDSVFKALGIDDRYIFQLTMRKVQSKEEYVEVTIEVFDGV